MSQPGQTREIEIPLETGGAMRAALAIPVSPAGRRGMVVLHEAFGLNDDIRRITGRWAEVGYVSVAPDLYSAGSRATCLTRVIVSMLAGVTSSVIALIDAAGRYLAKREDVDAGRIGVVGYCQGGGFALAVAPTGRFAAAGVNYGAVPRSPERLAGSCPVVASYGRLDRVMRSHGQRLERHLTGLGVPHDVKTYDGAGHSFFSSGNEPAWLARLPLPDPMHIGYVEPVAEDAWRRSIDFFEQHIPKAANHGRQLQ